MAGHKKGAHKKDTVFWHDAFYEALQLEFHQYMEYLEFTAGYPLSKEALKMDALVIKKEAGVAINKNIALLFRKYNIFEYKS